MRQTDKRPRDEDTGRERQEKNKKQKTKNLGPKETATKRHTPRKQMQMCSNWYEEEKRKTRRAIPRYWMTFCTKDRLQSIF